MHPSAILSADCADIITPNTARCKQMIAMPGPSHVGLAADLVEGLSGVVTEGDPAGPHSVNGTCSFAGSASSH